HCGDHAEIGWILERLRQIHPGRLVAVGVSLGGNALLRWAEEMGQQAGQVVQALAALSAPVDLAASGAAIGRGANRLLYTRMFLNTMKPRALQKLQQYPGLFDRQALLSARNLYDFDNVFTAPLHGFRDTDDYWQRASAKHALSAIRVPTLLLNARNDPFVPASSLPKAQEVGTYVTLWQPTQGGHAGFPAGRWSGQLGSMAEAVGHWLWQTIGAEAGLGHG
ncbi:MAG: YheT family hydrolase, partial [Rhodoferax sp.]